MMNRPRALALAATTLLTLANNGALAEINLKNFDLSVKPEEDFYAYVNGTWLKTAAIPADKSAWGTFDELDERSKANSLAILKKVSALSQPSAVEKMVGDFYASGMDEAAINAAGIKPIQAELDRIASLKDKGDIPALVAHLHQIGVGVGFNYGSEPDPKNSTMVIAGLGQGGLGLPDRDYYFNDDAQSKKLREDYVAHIGRMLKLAGESEESAKAAATAIMALETELARGSRTRTELRDPVANYNRMAVDDLQKSTPTFAWKAYFIGTGLENVGDLDVGQPAFFAAFDKLLAQTSLETWKHYFRWHLLSSSASYLSKDFDDENFAFYGKTLTGQQAQSERWKRILKRIDASIGEALGQLYVAEHFPPSSKEKMLKLVDNLVASMKRRLQKLEWMDEPTRAKALDKLAAIAVKIGYPDKWKDYSKLTISRDSYVQNVQRAAAFAFAKDIEKIGKPVDRTEWAMNPHMVNAYYHPQLNEIVFPAGILQAPFFDPNVDDALNYGGIGAVIGHEISHGFDDQGRQFDAKGNLADWWTAECAKRFKERTEGIVTQFNGYTAIDDLKVNGSLTQGENIADLAGLKIAYDAFRTALAQSPGQGKIDNFSPAQRFFLSWATGWRKAVRPEKSRLLVRTDPHSPAKFRVNGPFSNLDEFAEAFNIPEGSPMRRPQDKRVSIW